VGTGLLECRSLVPLPWTSYSPAHLPRAVVFPTCVALCLCYTSCLTWFPPTA